MTPEEREHSKTLIYQLLPSRYGMNPDDLRRADAIEVVVGQGAKPGGGGMLLGHKISDRVAEMRDLPKGIDQRSASRHPDWTGPDDLEIKIHELREITDWEKPVFVKVGATRTYYDVQLAVKAGADVIVVDGMQGGTAATQDVFIEHVGIPTLPATRIAVDALQELGMHRQVQLIVSGGIRSGADVAKALALGADAVSIGTAALIAMGDNSPEYEEQYRQIGSSAGFYDDYQAGRDPAGISTQDDELAARFDPVVGGRKVANYLRVLTLEAQTLARACGKSHVHNLEPEDLVALTIEAAAMARVPLAGTDWIPGATALLAESVEHVGGFEALRDLVRTRGGQLALRRRSSAIASKSVGVRPAADCVAAISRISATYRPDFAAALASRRSTSVTSSGEPARRSARTCSRTPLASAARSACRSSAVLPFTPTPCSSSPPTPSRPRFRPRSDRPRRKVGRRSLGLAIPRGRHASYRPARAAAPRSSRRRPRVRSSAAAVSIRSAVAGAIAFRSTRTAERPDPDMLGARRRDVRCSFRRDDGEHDLSRLDHCGEVG